MPKFTVVGFYDNNGNIFVQHVEAEDVNGAVTNTVKTLQHSPGKPESDTKYFRQNLNIVSVLEGHCKDLCEADSVSSAIDWPGLEVA